MADLEVARRQAVDMDARAKSARAQLAEMEQSGKGTDDVRRLLQELEFSRRDTIERLSRIRHAIGPSAF